MHLIHPVTVLVGNKNEAFLGWIIKWIQGYLGWICALIGVDYLKQGGLSLTQTQNRSSNIMWRNPYLSRLFERFISVPSQKF